MTRPLVLAFVLAFGTLDAHALALDAGASLVVPNGNQPLVTLAPTLTASLSSRLGPSDAGVRLKLASALSPVGVTFPVPNLFTIEGFSRWDSTWWPQVQLGTSFGFLGGVACLAGTSCGGVGLLVGVEGVRFLGRDPRRGWFVTSRALVAWGTFGSGTSWIVLPEVAVGHAW